MAYWFVTPQTHDNGVHSDSTLALSFILDMSVHAALHGSALDVNLGPSITLESVLKEGEQKRTALNSCGRTAVLSKSF